VSITGGIKVFNRSKALIEDDVSMAATSGAGSEARALDRNPYTYWRSVGSSDVVTETLIVTFPSATTIDRLFFIDINWKQFTCKYDSGGVFTDFTTVVGLDGALGGGIAETAYANTTAYYEVDSISTTRLEITITTTQVADEEKYVNRIVPTVELGTLVGYPNIKKIDHSRNQRIRKMLSGRSLVLKSEESVRALDLDFKGYPASYTADIALAFSLFDIEEDFLIWLCGGRYGTTYFRNTLRGFRLEDLYAMQLTKNLKVSYSKNIYINTVNFVLSMVEHV
jgi:hypothetical protein